MGHQCLPIQHFVVDKKTQGERKRMRKEANLQVNGLTTVEPGSLGAVTESPWEQITFAVDSGASETVIPDDMLESIPLQPSESARKGVQYEVANGERLPNLGEKMVMGVTEQEGLKRTIKAQVCPVNKPLLSVHRLVQAGNTVVFGPQGAFIRDAEGGDIWLEEGGGMYHLRMWVPTNEAARAGF